MTSMRAEGGTFQFVVRDLKSDIVQALEILTPVQAADVLDILLLSPAATPDIWSLGDRSPALVSAFRKTADSPAVVKAMVFAAIVAALATIAHVNLNVDVKIDVNRLIDQILDPPAQAGGVSAKSQANS